MSEVRGGAQEELPHVQGQGQWLRRATPRPRSGTAAERSNSMSKECGRRRAKRTYPMPEARGHSWEEQPLLQAVVAARVQEGLEELFHVQGQKGQQ